MAKLGLETRVVNTDVLLKTIFRFREKGNSASNI